MTSDTGFSLSKWETIVLLWGLQVPDIPSRICCSSKAGSVCSTALSIQAEFAAVFLFNLKNPHSLSRHAPFKAGEGWAITAETVVQGPRLWNKLLSNLISESFFTLKSNSNPSCSIIMRTKETACNVLSTRPCMGQVLSKWLLRVISFACFTGLFSFLLPHQLPTCTQHTTHWISRSHWVDKLRKHISDVDPELPPGFMLQKMKCRWKCSAKPCWRLPNPV